MPFQFFDNSPFSMARTGRLAIARVLIASLLVMGVPSVASAEQKLTLNLKDADLTSVISTVAQMTGKNFIVDPRVKGKVTVISSTPMNADQIYQTFLAILNVQGFAAVPTKNAIKIVPEVNAKQDAIPTVTGKVRLAGDQYVTEIIPVQNVSAAQLVPVLRPLLPQQAHLAALPSSNVLIASATDANVQRIAEIVHRVDVSTDGGVEVIPLQHASATEVVRVLQALYSASGQQAAGTEAPTLVADERTNSVLMGGGGANRLRLRAIITQLDTPLVTGGNTEVVYLRYSAAKDIATILQGLSKSITQTAGGKGQAATTQTEVNIQADEATNAVVINAPPDVMRSLKSVISQLDVRRAQVLVEAVIAEVSSQKANELGIQWVYDGSPNNAPVGLINFNGSGSGLGTLAAAAASNALAQVPDGLTLGVGDTNSNGTRFGALIRALTGTGDTNILSTPTLVTLDNEEAEIVVGQNVPFVTGSYTSISSSGSSTPTNPFQTIQRQDVGLTLKVKPQINEGNAVKLAISQEVSAIASSTGGAADLITNKRSLKTTVMVDDGQAVVLGGLIDDTLRDSVQKVPGLGDIPILGWLFSYKKTTKEKRNLMIFLRPIIMRNGDQAAAISGAKYSYLRAQELEARERGVSLMSKSASPVLPEIEKFLELPPSFEVWKRDRDSNPKALTPEPKMPSRQKALSEPNALPPKLDALPSDQDALPPQPNGLPTEK